MTPHRIIRRHFDELTKGELTGRSLEKVERHLQSCPDCRLELERIQGITTLLGSMSRPSELRDDQFWNAFASRVATRIGARSSRDQSWVDAVLESLGGIGRMRWRTVVGVAASFAVLVLALLLSQNGNRNQQVQTGSPTVAASDSAFDLKVGRYFRRSQAVLVALSNSSTESGRTLDIEAEQQVSRELAQEARLLKHQSLDPRSAHLVRNLEKIFIEVANADRHDRAHGIELIRGGIREENLLFKVRMAQARYNISKNERGNP